MKLVAIARYVAFDCKDNLRLRDAMIAIQEELGVKRYEQVTTPPPLEEEEN